MIFNNELLETDELRTGARNEFPYHVYTIAPRENSELVPLHWHPEVEIVYFQTTGILRIDGLPHDIKQGDIFFINPQQLHSTYENEIGKMYHIVFFAEALKNNYYPNYQNNLIDALINRHTQFVNKIEQTSEAYCLLLPLIKEIINIIETGIKDEYRGFLVQSVFNKIFYVCCKYEMFTKEEIKNNLYTEYIKKAMYYIQANYMENITIKDISLYINVSESYFYKIFKLYCGISPVNYINSIRLRAAYELLQKKIPVTEIAIAVGISNVSYFIRLFKNATGKTPYQWVKEIENRK